MRSLLIRLTIPFWQGEVSIHKALLDIICTCNTSLHCLMKHPKRYDVVQTLFRNNKVACKGWGLESPLIFEMKEELFLQSILFPLELRGDCFHLNWAQFLPQVSWSLTAVDCIYISSLWCLCIMFLFLLKICSPDTLLGGWRGSSLWYRCTYQGKVENCWTGEV